METEWDYGRKGRDGRGPACTTRSRLTIYTNVTLIKDQFISVKEGQFSSFDGPNTMRPVHTRNSSGDEIANVNFLFDDIVRVLQTAIDSRINSATDRRGCVETQVYQIQ